MGSTQQKKKPANRGQRRTAIFDILAEYDGRTFHQIEASLDDWGCDERALRRDIEQLIVAKVIQPRFGSRPAEYQLVEKDREKALELIIAFNTKKVKKTK